MKNKFKYLSKNFGLFLISSFFPKFLNFLLIPLYTTYLTTQEYGYSDLIQTTVFLLVPIFTLDIQDAVLRFSLDKKIDNKDVFSTSLKINIIGFMLVCLILTMLRITNILEIPNYFYLFLAINYLLTAIYNSFTLFCKGIDKVKAIVMATVLNSLVLLISNLILLVYLKLGIIGYLISSSLSNFISILFIFIYAKLYRYLKIKIDNNVFKSMIKYSFPLIFSVIAWWINSASDRYILTWFSGVAISGVYAISYKIPSILTALSSALYSAWSISSIKDFDKDDSDGFIGSMYTLLNFLLCFSCSVVMILNIFVAKILYSNTFFDAWHYVPPLLISVVFNAVGLFIGGIFTAVKDTKTLSISTIIGAIINTVLNFILIYYFSAYGAAIATMIGYFMVMAIRFIIVRRYIKMKTSIFKNFMSYFILMIQMFLAYFGNKYFVLQFMCTAIIIYIYYDFIFKVLEIIKNKLKKKRSSEV